MVTYLRFDHGVLLSTSPILMNAAIRLVGHKDGPFLGVGLMLSEKGIVLDLPLDERRVHAKFGCTGSYRDQMHNEQTNKQTHKHTNKLSSLYIRLAGVPDGDSI